MDALEIAHRRLHNQHLSGSRLGDPVEVVRRLGAVQAQEFGPAKWAIGMRTTTAIDAEIQRRLDDGSILRTHALRPTWHFVASTDIGWIQALTGPRVHVFNAYYNRMHGLDGDLTAKTNRAITAILRGGNHLTRKELAAALATEGFPAEGNRLAYVVMHAELEGLIASGVLRGKQQTYALVSERAPDPWTPDDPLAELTRRFFTSHGPATVKDFVWWSSLTVTQARRGIAALELDHVVVDGITYWFVPATPPSRDPSPTAYAVAGYDEYSVAYTESRSVLNIAGHQITPPNAVGTIQPIVLDSQVVGSWRRTASRDRITIEPKLLTDLTEPQRSAVHGAFARVGAFAGVPVEVLWSARRP